MKVKRDGRYAPLIALQEILLQSGGIVAGD
jgi:hypothetical protein